MIVDKSNNFFPAPRAWGKKALELAYKRYLQDSGLEVNDWFSQVAKHVCQHYSDDQKSHYQDSYACLLKSKAFLPTSAALANFFKEKGAFAGCIVLPLPNSIEEIFDTTLSKIMKMLLLGIGIGLDLSHLPPRLFCLKEKVSLGPVQTLLTIAQAVERPATYCGVKRSAFMATLFAQHPDIFEFIALKKHQKLANVNLSVSLDAAFKNATEERGLLPLMWQADHKISVFTTDDLIAMQKCADRRFVDGPDLEIRKNNKIFSRSVHDIVGRVIDRGIYVEAPTLLNFMATIAHSCGDPGLINLDAINLDNPTHPRHSNQNNPGIGAIKTTTPCGEQPLLPYEVCHLGSFNLWSFINNGSFNDESFCRTVKLALRFMDDLISVGDNGLNEANEVSLINRKIGLGVMGLADALAELEIPYDSPEAISFAHHVGSLLKSSIEEASESLAKERGGYLNFHFSKHQHQNLRRHATLTTIAPTGHIATLADCSFGIEPYYLIEFQREALGGYTHSCTILKNKLNKLDYNLQQWIADTQRKDSSYIFEGNIAKLIDNPFSDENKNRIIHRLKKVFKTSHEIDYKDHLNMISAWQKNIDNGISKTVNLSQFSDIDEIVEIFKATLQLNLKGITIFRDNSLAHQALSKPLACDDCHESKAIMYG